MPSPGCFGSWSGAAWRANPLRGGEASFTCSTCAGALPSPRTLAPRNSALQRHLLGGGARPSWRGPARLCAGTLTHATAGAA